MEQKLFSSEHIENEVLNLSSVTLSYEYLFVTKLQAKFDKYDQSFKNKKNN